MNTKGSAAGIVLTVAVAPIIIWDIVFGIAQKIGKPLTDEENGKEAKSSPSKSVTV